MNVLLPPERAQRMVEFHALDSGYPDFAELVDDLPAATWKSESPTGYEGAIQRAVDSVVLDHLMALAADDRASAEVRGIAALKIDELKKWIETQASCAKDETMRAYFFFAESPIDRFQKNPANIHLNPQVPPEGDPIGSDDWE